MVGFLLLVEHLFNQFKCLQLAFVVGGEVFLELGDFRFCHTHESRTRIFISIPAILARAPQRRTNSFRLFAEPKSGLVSYIERRGALLCFG